MATSPLLLYKDTGLGSHVVLQVDDPRGQKSAANPYLDAFAQHNMWKVNKLVGCVLTATAGGMLASESTRHCTLPIASLVNAVAMIGGISLPQDVRYWAQTDVANATIRHLRNGRLDVDPYDLHMETRRKLIYWEVLPSLLMGASNIYSLSCQPGKPLQGSLLGIWAGASISSLVWNLRERLQGAASPQHLRHRRWRDAVTAYAAHTRKASADTLQAERVRAEKLRDIADLAGQTFLLSPTTVHICRLIPSIAGVAGLLLLGKHDDATWSAAAWAAAAAAGAAAGNIVAFLR